MRYKLKNNKKVIWEDAYLLHVSYHPLEHMYNPYIQRIYNQFENGKEPKLVYGKPIYMNKLGMSAEAISLIRMFSEANDALCKALPKEKFLIEIKNKTIV